MGDRRDVCRALVGNSEVRNHLEDPDVDERKIIRWVIRKWYVGLWAGSS
jgi:hypothetical protein